MIAKIAPNLQIFPQLGSLFNERTFYPAFIRDMLAAKREVVIYSPFVSEFRADYFLRLIARLRTADVTVCIFTRTAEEYEPWLRAQVRCVLSRYEEGGARVFRLGGCIHEKAAIIDREILWEGSLNILSQRASREMMRRSVSRGEAERVAAYLGLKRKMAEGYLVPPVRSYRSRPTSHKWGLGRCLRVFMVGLAAWWILLGIIGMIALKDSQPLMALLLRTLIPS